jgi:hypothetical protein
MGLHGHLMNATMIVRRLRFLIGWMMKMMLSQMVYLVNTFAVTLGS